MNSFQELIKNENALLVDFYAEWCGPCKTMAPVLKEIKNAFGDKLKIIKIDVDKNPEAASAFHIRGVPTLILFGKGSQLWRQSGAVPYNELRGLIAQYID